MVLWTFDPEATFVEQINRKLILVLEARAMLALNVFFISTRNLIGSTLFMVVLFL